METVRYEEIQRFRQPWLWVLLVGVLLATALPVAIGLRDPSTFCRGPLPWVTGGVLVVPLGLLWMFYATRLEIRVLDEELLVGFWPLRPRSVVLSEIRSAAVVEYSPIGDYGGWGLRIVPGGRAYNVSGARGVRLEFDGGRHLLLGSQRPEELQAAIEEARSASRR